MGYGGLDEENDVAWLWTDTLADLLETIDRVEPEALSTLRTRPIAYRLADDGDPVGLARTVYREMSGGAATTPPPPSRPAIPWLPPPSHPA